MKNRKNRSSRSWKRFILPITALCALLILPIAFVLGRDAWPFGQNDPDSGKLNATFSDAIIVDDKLKDIFSMECGLEITDMAAYAGIYMEDGSNEIVSNIMMVVLKNTTEKDLQLARIELTFSDFSAKFEVTNLPAGASVVLLEKKSPRNGGRSSF